MGSVTAGGPGLVAVGSDGSDAAVWTSVDGITWSRVPGDEAGFGGTNSQWMVSVTAAGPGLVAVGARGGSSGDGVAAVWTSVDGVTWSRIPQDEAVFGRQEVRFGSESFQSMNSVTAGGPGLVAVGFDRPVRPDGVFDAAVWDAAVWTATTED
jgi:hypothetical protein